MIYVIVALLLLLAAVWVGLTLATQLVRPISSLIEAAERVRAGDLTARVEVATTKDETSSLGRAFNRMTSQLEAQQQGLIEANRQLDERRRFTETVLTGVSAGVIGLDGEGRINLPNRSASELLATDLEGCVGQELGQVVPEMAEPLVAVMERPERLHQTEVTLVRRRRIRTLLVRVAAERLGDDVSGYVVTFDDITELQSAQRKAAWADIARRIAHEIKNPLTPIQLSAERLKRKYLKEIKTDPETFVTCTETIIRQVGDIGRMIDEFSSFARMPQPDMKTENLSEIMPAERVPRTQPASGNRVRRLPAGRGRAPSMRRPPDRTGAHNVLKNAAESVNGRIAVADASPADGTIRLFVNEEVGDGDRRTVVAVEDNARACRGTSAAF